MTKNKFGEIVFNEQDLIDAALSGIDLAEKKFIVDHSVSPVDLDLVESELDFTKPTDESVSVEQFDQRNQSQWFMPDEYKNLDIAEYLLGLCNTDAELQRVGQELLLFQERNLFDLLRYLKYLVDVMKENEIVWGVGRGSSVASYVLYLLGVHRIDSMYYDLDPTEFLR